MFIFMLLLQHFFINRMLLIQYDMINIILEITSFAWILCSSRGF
jgi:hypothetical protein